MSTPAPGNNKPMYVEPYLDHIASSESLEDLRHFFALAYRHAQSTQNTDALQRIMIAKDLRKKDLGASISDQPPMLSAQAPAQAPGPIPLFPVAQDPQARILAIRNQFNFKRKP